MALAVKNGNESCNSVLKTIYVTSATQSQSDASCSHIQTKNYARKHQWRIYRGRGVIRNEIQSDREKNMC
jgi:hypothetical protein